MVSIDSINFSRIVNILATVFANNELCTVLFSRAINEFIFSSVGAANGFLGRHSKKDLLGELYKSHSKRKCCSFSMTFLPNTRLHQLHVRSSRGWLMYLPVSIFKSCALIRRRVSAERWLKFFTSDMYGAFSKVVLFL